MSNPLRLALRTFYSPIKNEAFRCFPFSVQTFRCLYSAPALGIDAFQDQKIVVKRQIQSVEEKFRERMANYTAENSGMIFTEDLKNMTYIADNDQDLDLVVKMAKKFNTQNKELRFGTFVFGPVIMRAFHIHNKADLALETFKSPELDGFFDQLVTFQILLDLLYENGKYQEILEVFDVVKSKQLQAAKYPRNCVVLVMAACYKMNSAESLKYAVQLWNELNEAGHFPMRRAATFFAGLAINQGKPELALDVICVIRKPNYITVKSLKAKALTQLGRLDEAIVVLKSIISEDQPVGVVQTFSRDVLDFIKQKVAQADNVDTSLEFDRLEKFFTKQGHITEKTLDELLCSEIHVSKKINQPDRISGYNRQSGNKFQNARYQQNNRFRRPGLKELV